MNDNPRVFTHRANSDGTFEAVCPDCLKAITIEHSEDRLESSEKNHFCNPDDLEHLWGRKRSFG